MSSPTPEHPSADWRLRTANDRFKALWPTRLAWSTVAAVTAHAAVFASWPSWRVPDIFRGSRQDLAGVEWVALTDVSDRMGGMSATAPLGEEVPEAAPPDDPDSGSSEGDGSTGLQARELTGLSRLRDRLFRQSMPVPTIAELDPERLGQSPAEGDPAATRLGGAPSAADLEELATVDPLELGRLAAVRPELALLAPSNWVLVSNPAEAERFMKTRFPESGGDMEETTSLSVAIWIDDRGSVEWAEIHQSSGRAHLDELALEFFREVVSFHPARDGWMRVPVSVIFWLSFPGT